MLNAILIINIVLWVPLSTVWAAESLPSPGGTMTSMCPELLRLQLFFLEEDLSVHSVRAGGCGFRAGGGWGLWSWSDQLQFCICQTILL